MNILFRSTEIGSFVRASHKYPFGAGMADEKRVQHQRQHTNTMEAAGIAHEQAVRTHKQPDIL